MSGIIWTPSTDMAEKTNVARFMRTHKIPTQEELIRRSVLDVEWFWDAALKDIGVEWYRPYDRVMDSSRGPEWTRWFVNGRINIAHNCVDRHAELREKPACIWSGENDEHAVLSYAGLARAVNRLAGGLKELGLGKGDPVALYMPMIPEVVISLLACFKIGAICVPIFSGFASAAVASRLRDVGAKAVITADGHVRRGKRISLKKEADSALETVPSVKYLIVVERLGLNHEWLPGRDLRWNEVVASEGDFVESERMDSEDAALVLYTSGTTGRPKGTVHTHAGALAQCSKDVCYYLDVKPSDVFFWVTDIGWMMGPWMIIGGLCLGATLVIMEGAIDYPAPDRLWSIVESRRISVLGISPTAIRALIRYGESHAQKHDLGSLRMLSSTGEPWDPESWMWYFKNIGRERCPIINISGGTEIIGCFLSPLPISPLKPCCLGPGLGMDVDVFDEGGRPVLGKVGYLVCKKPAPSMTRGFWNDQQRYLETYWSRWPGVWYHGDWASIDEDGFWFLHGRADDVIKIAGRRIGPAEIESVMMEHQAVSEAAAIGVPDELKGEAVVCFVVLKSGFHDESRLAEELNDHLAKRLGIMFKAREIRLVRALPKTRSGKIVRGLLKSVFTGESKPFDMSTIENPESLMELSRKSR